MALSEQITLITDYALAASIGYFAWHLIQSALQRTDLSLRLWTGAFVAASLSAFAEAAYVGFATQLDSTAAQSLWQAALSFACAAHFLLLSAVLCVYSRGRLRLVLLGLAVLKSAALTAWLADHAEFRYVVHDNVLTMLPVLALSAWGAWSRRVPSAPWILAGILASLVAALMQQGRVALHAHFDQNDLYHVIQIVAMYLFFRGGMELQDLDGEAAAPSASPAGRA